MIALPVIIVQNVMDVLLLMAAKDVMDIVQIVLDAIVAIIIAMVVLVEPLAKIVLDVVVVIHVKVAMISAKDVHYVKTNIVETAVAIVLNASDGKVNVLIVKTVMNVQIIMLVAICVMRAMVVLDASVVMIFVMEIINDNSRKNCR